RVGYLTMALEQKAGTIADILGAVKAEWDKLGRSLDILARRADSLTTGIRDTQRRTRIVGRKLTSIDAIDFARAERLLGTGPQPFLLDPDEDEQTEAENALGDETVAMP